MSLEAVGLQPLRTTPTRYAEADQATLLGLYHGYDQSRLALAKLVVSFGAGARGDEETRRRIWQRSRRQGIATDLFVPPSEHRFPEGLNRAAHAAALTAFATLSEKAEEVLRILRARWPELCEDAGGPLPIPYPEDVAADCAG